MAKSLGSLMFIFLLLTVLLALYGVSTPELEVYSEPLMEPFPQYEPKNLESWGFFGDIVSAVDHTVYNIILLGDMVNRGGLMLGLAGAVSGIADASMGGLPFFSLLIMGFMILFVFEIIRLLKP